MPIKVHMALAKALSDLGVDTMFGVIGDANLYMVDAFVRAFGGRYVAAANEAGGVLMALGYAQVSGKVGVATVTHGPGLTNTITALIEGVKTSVPMVLLVGDTPVEDRYHQQKALQREFITTAGAGFEQFRSPGTLAQDVAKAFQRAAMEHRPVALNMPAEFQWLDVDYRKPELYLPQDRSYTSSGPEMDNAIGIIAAARRPIVLGGRGAFEHGAEAAILQLADRIEAPLATTLLGKGLFADHPFNLGIFGTLSNAVGVEAIAQSDCVVAFGASLNRFTTDSGRLLEGKRVIHVNPQRDHVGRYVTPDAALVGDLELTAKSMMRWLDDAEIAGSGARTEELRQRIASFRPPEKVSGARRPGTVDMRQALQRLNEAMPANRIFVTDAGRYVFETWPLIPVARPRSFVFTVSYASIGLGLGQAIGAAVAEPERPTLLVCGDGGFMLGCLTEFATAVRTGCDIVILVCNDGSYGAEHVQFRRKNMDPGLSLFDWPDLAPVAEALGGAGVTVRSDQDLETAAHAIAARDRTRPLLIDLKLDPDCIPLH